MDAAPAGIAVSIITFGWSTPLGKRLAGIARSKPQYFYDPIDVRLVMPRDPSHARQFKVRREDNADAVQTQTAMLNDSRFYKGVKLVVDGVLNAAKTEASCLKKIDRAPTCM